MHQRSATAKQPEHAKWADTTVFYENKGSAYRGQKRSGSSSKSQASRGSAGEGVWTRVEVKSEAPVESESEVDLVDEHRRPVMQARPKGMAKPMPRSKTLDLL